MIFNWFRKKPEPTTAERLTKAIPTVMGVYGTLIERYPTAILDINKLPLSKEEMKETLKLAWKITSNQKMQDAIEHGYVHLSQFQDGVGEKPVDLKLPDNAGPLEVAAILEPYVAFSTRVTKETETLVAEFAAFKRT